VGVQRQTLATLPREGDSVPIVQAAGWAQVTVRTGAENLVPTGVQLPDRLIGTLIVDLFT